MSEELQTNVEAGTESKQEIPAELEGLSEEVAREAMKSLEPEKEEEPTPAEQDSDNKSVTSGIKPVTAQNIPYARFKEVNDKKNSVEKLLEQYKAKYGDLDNPKPATDIQPQPAQPVQPVQQIQQEPTPQPTPHGLTKEALEKINAEITRQALQISGLSQDEVDALEYADDDDADAARWKTAKEMARMGVYNQIAKAAYEQQERQRVMVENHQKLVQQYNDFYTKEEAEPDFAKIKEYASNEMFNALDDVHKRAISESFARIERQVASPQDVLLVMDYYTQAKKQFRSQTASKGGVNKLNEKIQQAAAHPRSEQIEGTVTADGENISIANLEEMMRTHKMSEIPEKYRNMLLGL